VAARPRAPTGRSEITIDLGALRRNVRVLRKAAAPAEVWAVVKADAYGHGAADVAPAAVEAGAAALCVATVQEGVELRSALADARIVVLGPLAPGEDETARRFRLEVTVSSPELPRGLAVHAKVDTGMGRWGMTPDELARVDAGSVVGVMSHLATADEGDEAFALAQIERFRALSERFERATRHLANSAATFRFREARLDAVRCGVALYGLSPFGTDPAELGLEPVLSWRSHVAQVRTLAAGESTGYGREFTAARPTRIGLVPVGYGDGFRRGLAGAEVLVAGARRRILGRISMDAFAVELPEGEAGDPVTLLGDGLLAEEHARALGTINYEITCGIRSGQGRALRRVVDGRADP
jgi:alanine racemase